MSAIAGFLSGMAGAMGLGGGGVLLLYLTIFAEVEQLRAQGVNLVFFIPTAIVAVIIYAKKGEIVWSTVIKMSFFGLLGALLGSYLADILGPQVLRKLFALFLLGLGIKELFSKNKRPTKKVCDLERLKP